MLYLTFTLTQMRGHPLQNHRQPRSRRLSNKYLADVVEDSNEINIYLFFLANAKKLVCYISLSMYEIDTPSISNSPSAGDRIL